MVSSNTTKISSQGTKEAFKLLSESAEKLGIGKSPAAQKFLAKLETQINPAEKHEPVANTANYSQGGIVV